MVFIKLYKDEKKLINILSATLSELLILQSRAVEPAWLSLSSDVIVASSMMSSSLLSSTCFKPFNNLPIP